MRKLIKKLNIRHLNGHLDFSSGFQVIDPSNYEKVLKSRKNPEHWCKNMLSKAHSSLTTGKIEVTI